MEVAVVQPPDGDALPFDDVLEEVADGLEGVPALPLAIVVDQGPAEAAEPFVVWSEPAPAHGVLKFRDLNLLALQLHSIPWCR